MEFLKCKLGLVGGHCKGADPYYLSHKAESLGYHPQVVLFGRRLNDMLGMFVANKLVKLLITKNNAISKPNVLVLDITFKENCPDIRNSKVIDIVKELLQFNINVFNPHANSYEVEQEFGIKLIESIKRTYTDILLAVSHDKFKEIESQTLKTSNSSIIYDIK